MDDKGTTSSTGNEIYDDLDEWLEDKEPPTFDFDDPDAEDHDDES